MAYFLLLVGLVLLIFGGNIFVSSAISLARKWHISSLLIGLLFVGFGTSLPELITSLISVARGVQGIAIGNVVGSNIANILLVLGICAIIQPIKIPAHAFSRDAIFLGISTVVLLIAVLKEKIGVEMGALMCLTLAFYVYHAYQTDKKRQKDMPIMPPLDLSEKLPLPIYLNFILFVSGLILMLWGAHILVNNAVLVAGHFGVSETVIGLTVIALGTSLPELTTSVLASLKGESDMAVGNVVGSNIYNALFILGFTALWMPVLAPYSTKGDVIAMTFATLLLLGLGWFKGSIGRRMGFVFVALYAAYIMWLGLY